MTNSHSWRAGSPSSRRAASRAIISASVEECGTAVCFLHSHDMGANVREPISARMQPEVDFESCRAPAKDASQNSASVHSSALFPPQEV